jgi:hypothetical protein
MTGTSLIGRFAESAVMTAVPHYNTQQSPLRASSGHGLGVSI